MQDTAATYRDVFGVRGYRHLFAANVLSLIGDQLTAVALAFAVYALSNSAILAAVTFAGSYLTWIVGGPVLSVFADRFPRRRVLIACDLARAALVLLMAVPGAPVLALVGLAFVANLFRPPFQAARAATVPDLLDGDRYTVANGLDNIVAEITQVLGFAVGGVLVMTLSPTGVLLIDAATFLVSALLVATGLRPEAAPAVKTRASWAADTVAGVRVVFGNPTLRAYLLLFWLSCLVYGAEGVVAPLAGQYGGGARTGGLLLAAMPAGVAIGGVLLTRFVPPGPRQRLMLPLALVSCAALIPVLAVPPLPVVLVLLFVSGLAGSFSIPLNALFGRAVPADHRARAFGVAMSGLCAVQGLAMVAAGAAAERFAPTTVVAGAGVVATICAAVIVARWPRAASHPTGPTPPAAPEPAPAGTTTVEVPLLVG